MNIPLGEVVYFDVVTSSPTTGAAADADSTPTFEVFEESTDTDIGVGGSLTKRTSKTGNYRGSFTASSGNGFEAGKWYSVVASATVGGVAGKSVVRTFRAVAAENVAGYPLADVGYVAGTAATTSDGTATAGGASTITLGTGVTYGTDLLKGRRITLVGGTGAGQSRVITSNTNATPSVATVHRAWDTQPSTDTTYVLEATAEADARLWGGTAVTGMPMPTYAQPTGFLAATFPATVASTTNITTVGAVSGGVAGSVGSVAAGGITAASFAADVDAEILSYLVDDATRIDASALNTLSSHDPGETIMGATDLGTGAGLTSLASAANLATVAGYLDTEIAAIQTAVVTSIPATLSTIAGYIDTEVAAIKAKTDLITTFPSNFSSLSITSGGVVSADVKAVNAVTLQGAGVLGNEWRPA